MARFAFVLLSALVVVCLLVFDPRLENANLPKELVWWSGLLLVMGVALVRGTSRDWARWRVRVRLLITGPLRLFVVLWVGWFAWWCVSAMRSSDPVAGWIGALRFAGYGATFLVFFALRRGERRRFAVVVAAVCCVIAGVAVLQRLGVLVVAGMYQGRPPATLGNPNFAANGLAAFLPVAAAWGWGGRKRWRGWIVSGGVVLVVGSVVATGSRAGLVALASGALCAGGLWLFWWFPAKNLPRSTKAIAIGSVVLMLTWLLVESVQFVGGVSSLGRSETVRLRVRMWERSMVLVKERPIAGWGAGAYRVAMEPEKVWIEPVGGDRFPKHAHSWFVEALVEQGLVGVVLMLSTWGTLAWCFLRGFGKRRREWMAPLAGDNPGAGDAATSVRRGGAWFCGAGALLGGTLVGVWLNWWGGGWLLWMLFGLTAGWVAEDVEDCVSKPGAVPRGVRACGYVLLVLGIVCVGFGWRFYRASRLDFEAKRRIDRRAIPEARGFLDAALRCWPFPRDVWFHDAEARFHAGDFGGALEALEAYLDRAPETSDMLVLRGSILQKLGRMDEALVVFRRAREREPSGDKAIVLARVLLGMGRIDEAEGVLRAQLERMVYAPLVEFYADGMRRAGRGREALVFVESLNGAPGAGERNSRAALALAEGRLALGLGDARRASKALERAVKGPPGERYAVWNDYATALWRAGEVEGADRAFARAQELAPERFEAAFNRLELAAQRRDSALGKRLMGELETKSLPDVARRRLEAIRRGFGASGRGQ